MFLRREYQSTDLMASCKIKLFVRRIRVILWPIGYFIGLKKYRFGGRRREAGSEIGTKVPISKWLGYNLLHCSMYDPFGTMQPGRLPSLCPVAR